MTAADFRRIENRGETGHPERLLRAAVSAFSSLTRPTRRETLQLDQLAAPLFDRVSPGALRYVAAVLSDSPYAPRQLIERLCHSPADIAAPLLIRSPLLNDADLIGLVARQGLAHARIIKRRPRLNRTIMQLILALEASAAAEPQAETPVEADDMAVTPHSQPGRGPAEQTRRALLAIMSGNGNTHAASMDANTEQDRPDGFRALRAGVLSDNRTRIYAALAEAVSIGYDTARLIVEARSYDDLLAALRYLDLPEERAFLLVCAASPWRFARPQKIRAFLEQYRSIGHEEAARRVAGWRDTTGIGDLRAS